MEKDLEADLGAGEERGMVSCRIDSKMQQQLTDTVDNVQFRKEVQVPAWKKIWKPKWVVIQVPAVKDIQVPAWKKYWIPQW